MSESLSTGINKITLSEDDDSDNEKVDQTTYRTFQECLAHNADKINMLSGVMESKKIIYSRITGAKIREELRNRVFELDSLSQTNNNLSDKLNLLTAGKLRNKIKEQREQIRHEVIKQQQITAIIKYREDKIYNSNLRHKLNVAKVNAKIQSKDREIEKLKAMIKEENERQVKKPAASKSNTKNIASTLTSIKPSGSKRSKGTAKTTISNLTSSTTPTKSLPMKPSTNEKKEDSKSQQQSKFEQQQHQEQELIRQQLQRIRQQEQEEQEQREQQQQKQREQQQQNQQIQRQQQQNQNRNIDRRNNSNSNNNNNNNYNNHNQNRQSGRWNNRRNRYWNNSRFAPNNNTRPFQSNNNWKIPRRVQEIPIEESMTLQAKRNVRRQERIRNRQKNFETQRELDQLRRQYMLQEKTLNECRRELKKKHRLEKEKAAEEVISSKQEVADGVDVVEDFEF